MPQLDRGGPTLSAVADVSGALAAIDRWKIAVADEMQGAYKDIVEEVKRRVLPNIPVVSGDLKGDIRSSVTARAGIVTLGRSKIPYAGPAHWGWQQSGRKTPHARKNQQNWKTSKPGPQFLWLVAFPSGSSKPPGGGPADWIEEMMIDAVNTASEKAGLSGRERKAAFGSGATTAWKGLGR